MKIKIFHFILILIIFFIVVDHLVILGGMHAKYNMGHKYTIVHLERMQTSTTQNEVLETRQSRRLRKMLKMGQVSIPFRTSQWVKNEGK